MFKKAHVLTREIRSEYPEVDYRAQFGLCLSYLLAKEEETEVKKVSFEKKGMECVVRLDGTELVLTIGSTEGEVVAYNNRQHGWGYNTKSEDIGRRFGVGAMQARAGIFITDPSAEKMYEAQAQAERNQEQAERNAYLTGEKLIRCDWRQGSPLSGYVAENETQREILKGLGLAKDISGWGTLVDKKLVETLGEQFTYEQAKAYTQPKLDEKAEKKATAEKSRQEKFDEAKKTGDKVILRTYHTDCNDPEEECDLDKVTVWAMPDGTTTETRVHTW